MRRSTWLILLAACAPLPALAWRGDGATALRGRIARTAQSLSDLAGIQSRIAAGNPAAVGEILSACEAGPADPAQAELDLASLRVEVQALQMKLDAAGLFDPMPEDGAPGFLEAAPKAAAVVPEEPATSTEVPPTPTATAKTRFEPEGFIADRARLGRACWRGGRYQEGVAALEPLAGDVQADYWRARCLEKLARPAEALALYGVVIERAGDSAEGRSAREDRDFLQWSMDHGLVSPR